MGNFRQHIIWSNSDLNNNEHHWYRQQMTDDGIPYSTPHLGPYYKGSNYSYGYSTVGVAETAYPKIITYESTSWGNSPSFRSSDNEFDDDEFGFHIAVGNNTLLIGAPEHKGQYTGSTRPGKLYRFSLNATWYGSSTYDKRYEPYNYHHFVYNQYNNTIGINAGIAGTHVYSGTSSSSNNGNPANTLRFGRSVAAACDRIAVGAPGADGTSNNGTVKIFEHNSIIATSQTPLGSAPGGDEVLGNWNFLPTTLKTLYGDASGDRYGHDVAIGCGRIVVGAPLADRGSTNYNEGAAYIYDLNGNNPIKIGPEGSSHSNKRFGSAVAIGNGKVVVSRPEAEQVLIYDLDGNQTGVAELKFDSGTTYNYVYESNRQSEFGTEKWYAKQPGMLSVGQGRIVVGAIEQRGTSGYYAPIGAVYIYNLKGKLIKRIQAPDADVRTRIESFTTAGRNFGRAVTVGMGFIFVGDNLFDERHDYTRDSNNIPRYNPPVGKVYVFDLDGDFIGEIPNPDINDQRYFGKSLAVSEEHLFIGSSSWNNALAPSQSDGGADPDFIGRSKIWRCHLHNASYNIYDRIEMENGWLHHS
jgi:hypothetical protein